MATENRVKIESLDQEGRGVARIEGKVIFIEGALTGEVVSYSSYRKKPSFELAQVTQIHKSSAMRVQPKCSHFGVWRRLFDAASGRKGAGCRQAAHPRRHPVAHRQGQGGNHIAADLRSALGLS